MESQISQTQEVKIHTRKSHEEKTYYEYIPERRDIYNKEKKKHNYDNEILTPSGGSCQVSRIITDEAVDIEGYVKPLRDYDTKKMDFVVQDMLKENIINREQVQQFIRQSMKKYAYTFSPSQLLYHYRIYTGSRKDIKYDKKYEQLLQSKTFRSQSGVMVITVFTSPYPEVMQDGKWVEGQFSCKFDCYYCPNEPGQPRSYLLKEPGVHRANSNKFDPIKQFWDRANSYMAMGHPVDKIELLILGGTWHSYPSEYRQKFIRDIFFAGNTYFDYVNKTTIREPLTLQEEQVINQTNKCRIIGVTIETRPDMITPQVLQDLRKLGVTRVQLGVQSTDDRILYRINRRCYNKHTIRAIRLLKDNCFKIDIHIMPDLPQPLKEGVSNTKEVFTIEDIDTSVDMQEVDRKMMKTICFDPDFQIDQIKVYPCETLPWTRLEQDYKNGSYKPYGHQKDRTEITPLHDVLLQFLKDVPEWVRINRIIRDIPDFYILGGNMDINMRNVLDDMCIKQNIYSRDIRNREVKKKNIDPKTAVFKMRKYNGSQGDEYFLSFETPDEKYLFGFLRLRLSKMSGRDYKTGKVIFPELLNCAMIRELHVYGNVMKVGEKDDKRQQHQGFGTRLLQKAFEISQKNNYNKIAVISGIGVMNYYRKFGFEQNQDQSFMIKNIPPKNNYLVFAILILVLAYIYFQVFIKFT
jgi:ELP3 family radical SAM enzyme/protein acetyltransferase